MEESKWYAYAMMSLIIVSSSSYTIIDSEVIEPQLNNGNAYEFGRYTFTSEAFNFIENRENKSVIALGSSKMREAFNGIDLEQNSQINGLEFFNLAYAGERPYYRMLEIENIINSAPELVILEIGPTTFSQLNTPVDDNSKGRMNVLLRQQEWQRNPSWLDIMDEEDQEILAISISERIDLEKDYSTLAFENTIIDIIGPSSNTNCTNVRCVPHHDSKLYLEYLKYPTQFTDHLGNLKLLGGEALANFYGASLENYMNKSYHNPEGKYNKNHRAFDFIIDELIDNQIQVLLVGAPYNPVLLDRLTDGKWDYYNSSVENYSIRQDINVVDLMWDYFDSDIYFNDYTHLSNLGEKLFTDSIIKIIDNIIINNSEDLNYDTEHNYTRESQQLQEELCKGNEESFPINGSEIINSYLYSGCGFGSNDIEQYKWNYYEVNGTELSGNELMVLNSFDKNSSEWTNQSSGNVNLGENTEGFDFSQSLQLTNNGLGTWLGTQAKYFRFNEGETYDISGDIYIPQDWDGGAIYFMDGSTLSDNDEEYNYGHKTIYEYETDTASNMADKWQKINTITNIGSDTHGKYYLRTKTTPSEGKYIYLDNFSITRINNDISYMKAEPDSNSKIRIPAFLSYDIDIIQEGNYSIWLELRGMSGRSDSVHVTVDGLEMTHSGNGLSAGSTWKWTNEATNINPLIVHLEMGIHEIRVIMREDGVEFSRIFITNTENGRTPMGW